MLDDEDEDVYKCMNVLIHGILHVFREECHDLDVEQFISWLDVFIRLTEMVKLCHTKFVSENKVILPSRL